MTTFNHSGNAGDIIYSIPFMNGIKGLKKLYLQLNRASGFTAENHPVGNVMLNKEMAENLLPLLKYVVDEVEIVEDAPEVDYNLDLFRLEYKNLAAGNISLWHSVVYPAIQMDLSIINLYFTGKIQNDYTIINRSERYNNLFIDLSEYNQFDNLKFVGTDKEFRIISASVKNIEHLKVDNFLVLAQYIAGCKLFIGNQSMPFAIAEQLKVKRILEQHYLCPNVIPQGGECYVYQTNDQLKNIINLIK